MTDETPLPPKCLEAIEAIGPNPPGNSTLVAEKGGFAHIQRLEEQGAATAELVRVLNSTALQEAFKGYDRSDREAITAQASFKSARRWVLFPLMLAVGIGLFSFMAPEGQIAAWFSGGGPEHAIVVSWVKTWLVHASTWAVFGLLAVTPFLALVLRPKPEYDRWMIARGTAESWRRKLFDRVMAAPMAAVPGGIDPLLLKLEYFRRYQLEVQAAYHDKKSFQHGLAVDKAQVLRRTFIGFLALWGVLLVGTTLSGKTEQGAISPLLDMKLTFGAAAFMQYFERQGMDIVVLALSTLLALVYVAVLYNAYLSKSARNEARFTIMGENLDKLKAKLDSVRREAAAGNSGAVKAYVELVHSVMSVENADWVRLQALDDAEVTAHDAAVHAPMPSPSG